MLSFKPDEGWSWIVLFASFGAKTVCGYTYYNIAVFTLAMQQEFPDNEFRIAWVSGIFLCMTNMAGK